MVKISIFYPSKPGARFDVDYYLKTHMPLTIGLLGPAVQSISVEIGVIGGLPDQPPPFTAICSFVCDTAETFTAAFLPNADLLQGDIVNYTDITPVIQVSQLFVTQTS